MEIRKIRRPYDLAQLGRDRWREYDGSIHRVFMITELYYGSLEITIDPSREAEVQAALETGELKGKLATRSQRKRSYVFSHQGLPLAMRLERVKHFNG